MARSTLLQDMLIAVRLYFLRRENRGEEKGKGEGRGKEEGGERSKGENRKRRG